MQNRQLSKKYEQFLVACITGVVKVVPRSHSVSRLAVGDLRTSEINVLLAEHETLGTKREVEEGEKNLLRS